MTTSASTTESAPSAESVEPKAGPGALPLAGLLVVGFEQAVAAPLATRHLADFGARVIKVENPNGGDMARSYDGAWHDEIGAHFAWLNRGKESFAVNLRDERGAAALEELLAKADVVVQNLAPGAAARRGLAAEQLVERFPRIIAVDISGYGDGGPLSHKRAYDLLVQSESGSCAITGHEGHPAKAGIPLADIGGGMYTLTSVLAALHARTATGRGAAIQVSLFDAAVEWMGYALNFTMGSGLVQEPNGVSSPAVSPYGNYRTKDGQVLVLGTTNNGEWQRLAREILGSTDLAEDKRFAENDDRVRLRADLDVHIAAWARSVTLADAREQLDKAGIGNARLNTVPDVIDHPHLAARDRWREVATPSGPIRAVLPPPVNKDWTFPMGDIPALGAHTASILTELGHTPDDLAALHADGVI
ncbi:CoA transferase [Frankia sp. AgB1.9]|uniref:CaiB/BaiF CoA transferase family protein n=1 Tax=unclassified Frankia TaxID=2632575 RepID=UPI001932B4B2|nr:MULTISPECIES: CaiB/BaiF CoA-transferase family protein [unclassified Frankia]MBL7486981.1 CoA transferase [Frankia sp. AgW1.1]MBL7548844.1 CoA transferase [Frankia sp. AgB1.9]MBL7619682.1 CoA transferase [Frankia sp. AgB1.8]